MSYPPITHLVGEHGLDVWAKTEMAERRFDFAAAQMKFAGDNRTDAFDVAATLHGECIARRIRRRGQSAFNGHGAAQGESAVVDLAVLNLSVAQDDLAQNFAGLIWRA